MNKKRKRLKKLFLSALFFVGSLALLPAPLYAQMSCSGAACPYLPVSQYQLDQLHLELTSKLAQPLVENFSKASAAANIMTPYIGTTNLQGLTFGGSLATGFHNAKPKDITINNVGTLTNTSLYAAQAVPTLFAGVNLGSLLGHAYDPYSASEESRPPPHFSPARFDVLVMGLKYEYKKDTKEQGQIVKRAAYGVRNKGFQIRYHLAYGKNWLGPFLRWQGLSIMAGMMDSHTSLDYTQRLGDSQTLRLAGGVNVVWMGDLTAAKITSDIKTYPVELQTGIQLLYFLNITIGGGVAWNHGGSRLFLYKNGRAFAESDVLSALNVDTSSLLSYSMIVEGGVPAQMAFAKLGVEINAAFLKVGVQAMATQDDNYGGSVSLRFEF